MCADLNPEKKIEGISTGIESEKLNENAFEPQGNRGTQVETKANPELKEPFQKLETAQTKKVEEQLDNTVDIKTLEKEISSLINSAQLGSEGERALEKKLDQLADFLTTESSNLPRSINEIARRIAVDDFTTESHIRQELHNRICAKGEPY